MNRKKIRDNGKQIKYKNFFAMEITIMTLYE